MELKIVYFVVTSDQSWGKGLSLAEAMKNAGFTPRKTITVQANLYFALFKKETTPEELKNLYDCITADQVWGTPMFYEQEQEPTYDADQEMINRLFVGWASDHVSYRVPKKEKQRS